MRAMAAGSTGGLRIACMALGPRDDVAVPGNRGGTRVGRPREAEAVLALGRFGPFAIGPPAAAPPRVRSSRPRLAIAGALVGLPHHDRGEAAKALDAAVRRKKDPDVQARLAAARLHVQAGMIAEMHEAQRK
jgi:hypothetical protein